MITPRLLAGPPAIQSSARRNAQTGSVVRTTTRTSAGSEAIHAALPAYGFPMESNRNAMPTSISKKTIHFSGHARRIGSPLQWGAVLTTFLILVATPAWCQQLFYPWAAVTTTATPGTITAGNAFQTALASNANRKGCILINTSTHTLYVFFGALANALTTTSVPVGAGSTFPCNVGPVVMTDGVQVTTSTTNDTFVVLSMQ